jgi:hypothetical protein
VYEIHSLIIWRISVEHAFIRGCETWSLSLREANGSRVFENKVLGRIFGPKREEVEEGWRRLHNEKRHNIYASTDIIRVINSRRMSWVGRVACMGR